MTVAGARKATLCKPIVAARCGFKARAIIEALALYVCLLLGFAPTHGQSQGSVQKFETVLTTGHSAPVHAVAFSPDGRTIASGSLDNTVKLWDAATGRELRTLTGHSGWVNAVAFSPDGLTVASGSSDDTLRIWQAASGRELSKLKGNSGGIFAVAFSPDGHLVVAGSRDGTLTLWDAASGEKMRALTGHSGTVFSAAFSPDGRIILSGGEDGTLKLWDVASGRELRTLKGHQSFVKSVRFSKDGRAVVSGSWDSTVKLWDVASGRELRTLTGHRGSVDAVAFSSDGSLIASAGADRTVKLWDPIDGRELRTFAGHLDSVDAVAFSPDGRTVASGGEDKSVKLWNTSGQELRTLTGSAYGVSAVAFFPDGRTIVSGSTDKTLKLWEASSGRELRVLAGHLGPVLALAISPDGRTIVSGSADSTMKVWDAAVGRELRTLNGHSGAVFAVALSPDGRTIVPASEDGWLKLWFSGSDRPPRELIARATALAFAPNGNAILLGESNGYLELWDINRNRWIKTLEGPHSDRSHSGPVAAVAFSPDGRTIVSGSVDNTIKLWDAAGKQEPRTLTGHLDTVQSVAFSPDGRTIVSGSYDKTLKLWNTANGQELRTLTGHSGSVNAVAFSPDGRTIASGSKDGTLRLWNLDGKLLATMAARSDGEWLTITPEGFFDGSADGAKLLSVVHGLDAYSVDQLYDQLHRPDLVREKLAGDPAGKVRDAAAKLDLSKILASGRAPSVAIKSPAAGANVEGEQTNVEATIGDRGGGIGKIELRVNGVTIGIEERGFERIKNQNVSDRTKTVSVNRTVGLTPGENRIAVLAYNEAGLIASEPAEIIVNSAQQSASKPNLYVLAVGVNDYWDSALHLNYASPDAAALSGSLKQAGSKLYERVEVRTVLDGEVTAKELDAIFGEFGKKVQPQDVFVFFLAGHGKTVDARFYFLPYDFRYTDEMSVTKSGIGQNQLQEWMSRIRAQKSVLLFDACESGSLIGDKLAMRGIEQKTAIDRMTRAMGRTILTATTDSKPAIEGYRGHGVFTYTLLEGLDGADSNGDGVVDVTELAQYVDRRLPDLTYDVFHIRQVPQMSIVGSNFPLVSKVPLSAASRASASSEANIPNKPTHVIIAPADVRSTASDGSATVTHLSPGTQVRLLETQRGWVLIARDGQRLGFVQQGAVAGLQ